MDDNRVPADQSQALPSARPITERLNFAITGSGEWSAENLFIFPANATKFVSHMMEMLSFMDNNMDANIIVMYYNISDGNAHFHGR